MRGSRSEDRGASKGGRVAGVERERAPRDLDLQELDDNQLIEPVCFDFAIDRRTFVQVFGAGVLVTVAVPALAQRRRGRGRGGPPPNVSARIHIGPDGTITVLTGKTEMGQGARGQIAQAAAEELRVPLDRVQLTMADTGLVPNDGNTAGSRTTSATVPSVRQGAAAARDLMVAYVAKKWNIQPQEVQVHDGTLTNPASNAALSYADLAQDESLLAEFAATVPADVSVTPTGDWEILGTSYAMPNRRALVTGAHQFPSDMSRPDMLYGKILRPPAYKARLASIDLAPAQAIEGVQVVRDGDFVGVAAPNSYIARQAIEALAATAQWQTEPLPSTAGLYDYLRQHARGTPANPFADQLAAAPTSFKESYNVAYVQHAPLEPRVALAEWADGKLTVWTGTQNPFGYRGELSGAFHLPEESVRVIVPDFGSGFGGKHTAEAAIEAARLARGVGRPVLLRWTREEEFTWAYFRPAGVIDIEATLDDQHKITSWYMLNINSGGSAIETPYNVAQHHEQDIGADAPLRQGSYRALAATANTFARESAMDELAAAVSVDPLGFRLAHLDRGRLREVLEEAAHRFNWRERWKQAKQPSDDQGAIGIGLACGTEKGSFVAACVKVAVDPESKRIDVLHVCEVFECGAITTPDNLRSQVEGAIIMGLGPALEEEIRLADNTIENPTFRRYRVPHFSHTPMLDIVLLNRLDLPSVGGGETPIIAIAPAIANAVYHATGQRVRQMPIRL